MNAKIAGHAGIQKLKRFHMVNIKELHGLTSRKCNTRQRSLGGLPVNGALNSDQVISLTLADGCNGSVHPGPGLKPQAPSLKLQALKDTSHKLQAPSNKLQAPSRKLQAPRFDYHEKVSRHLNQGPGRG